MALVLAIYGERSADRFLKFTENDGPGVAFKRHPTCFACGSPTSTRSPATTTRRGRPWKGDFAPLRAMVAKNTAAFSRLDVRAIVRKAARAASTYLAAGEAAVRRVDGRLASWVRVGEAVQNSNIEYVVEF